MRIAIVGAGIAGLRAGLELAPVHQVTIFEKSPGVGGRVATRRFGEIPVNHGATSFDRRHLLIDDPVADYFRDHFDFAPAATNLPKAMRDLFFSLGGKLQTEQKVKSIEDLSVHFENGTSRAFDKILLTPPLPQVREILGKDILPEVSYDKTILFIGERNGNPVTEILDPGTSEKLFELSDEEIRKLSSAPTEGLALKKWRYSRVRSGHRSLYYPLTDRVFIAGDAFDPHGIYDVASAWNSGRFAGSMLV